MSNPPPKTVPCKYKTGKTLGSGTYAVVKEAVHVDTGKYYAAKVMNKSMMRGREHMIRNEISILKKISQGHPNIITLVDFFETMNNLYLITELATGGELFDRICDKGSFYETDAAKIVHTVLDAVAYLHDMGIVHRDLKPENLLFKTNYEDSPLMIGDFGLSRIIDTSGGNMLNTLCGTPGYMSPELFLRKGHSTPVDLWAIGVITYYLLCGYAPFERDDESAEVQAIVNADYSFTPTKYWEHVSEEGKDFIRKLLVIDPNARMTAKQALEHPWICKYAVGLSRTPTPEKPNLLPNVRENFNAKKTFRKAVGLVTMINKLKQPRILPVEEDIHTQEVTKLGNDSQEDIVTSTQA